MKGQTTLRKGGCIQFLVVHGWFIGYDFTIGVKTVPAATMGAAIGSGVDRSGAHR